MMVAAMVVVLLRSLRVRFSTDRSSWILAVVLLEIVKRALGISATILSFRFFFISVRSFVTLSFSLFATNNLRLAISLISIFPLAVIRSQVLQAGKIRISRSE